MVIIKRLLLFFCFSCGSFLFGANADSRLTKVPFLERYCIKIFFDQAIGNDQAAHVLFFNNKPVCLTGPALKCRDKTVQDRLSLRGWRAFKKYKHLFPHPNFIFTENIFGDSDEFKILHIYIINKTALQACLDENLLLFQKVLGPNFSLKAFITDLENGKSLPDLIKKDESLMGLILGYGKESAQAFEQMISLYSENMPPPQTETYCRIDLETPQGCKIHPVVFMGNPQSKEVQELKAQYEKELEEIWALSRGKKLPLNLVLKQLTQEPTKSITLNDEV